MMKRLLAPTAVAVLALTLACAGILGTSIWSQDAGLGSIGLRPASNAVAPPGHAANATALVFLTSFGSNIMRDDVGVAYSDTGANCVHADGYAQVQTTVAGHCMVAVPGTRWTPRIWGANGNDDSAAWAAALAYLGYLGGPQRLDDDLPASTISSATRLTIPTDVEVAGLKHYEGGDGTPLAGVTFTSATGGFYMADKSAMSGLNLISTAADHLVEIGGQVGIDHVRVSTVNSGILTTHNLAPGVSSVDGIGASKSTEGSGLTNGTYSKVAFEGGGGAGATLSITVSGGIITAATFDQPSTSPYAADFQIGLAANALYSGSPALSNIGDGLSINGGRTHVDNSFVSSVGKGTCLEMPPGFDFEHANNDECWNSTGSMVAGSVGYAYSKADGLSTSNFQCFAYDTCIKNTGATNIPPDFRTFEGVQIDLTNTGIADTQAEANLTITGGYIRALRNAIDIDNPLTNFAITGTSQLCQVGGCTIIGSAKTGTITGNNYHRDQAEGVGSEYIQIGPSTNTGALESIEVSGNAADLNGPFIYLNTYANNAHIGMNAWPYGSSWAYLRAAGAANATVVPIHMGQASLSPNASGVVAIPHGLGYVPKTPEAYVIGNSAARAIITGIDATNITITLVNPITGAALTSGTYRIVWRA